MIPAVPNSTVPAEPLPNNPPAPKATTEPQIVPAVPEPIIPAQPAPKTTPEPHPIVSAPNGITELPISNPASASRALSATLLNLPGPANSASDTLCEDTSSIKSRVRTVTSATFLRKIASQQGSTISSSLFTDPDKFNDAFAQISKKMNDVVLEDLLSGNAPKECYVSVHPKVIVDLVKNADPPLEGSIVVKIIQIIFDHHSSKNGIPVNSRSLVRFMLEQRIDENNLLDSLYNFGLNNLLKDLFWDDPTYIPPAPSAKPDEAEVLKEFREYKKSGKYHLF